MFSPSALTDSPAPRTAFPLPRNVCDVILQCAAIKFNPSPRDVDVDMLMAILQAHAGSTEAQESVYAALVKLSGNPDCAAALSRVDAVGAVIAAAKAHPLSLDVLLAACAALRALGKMEARVGVKARVGIVKATLYESLERWSNMAVLVADCLSALNDLTDPASAEYVTAPQLDILNSVIDKHGGPDGVCVDRLAATLLSTFARSLDLVPTLLASGSVRRVFAIMERRSMDVAVQEAGCLAVCRLAHTLSQVDPCLRPLLDGDTLPILLAALERFPHLRVVAEAGGRALRTHLGASIARRKLAVSAEARGVAVPPGSPRCDSSKYDQKRCVGASCDVLAAKAVSFGAIPIIAKVMRANTRNFAVLELVCDTMGCLASSSSCPEASEGFAVACRVITEAMGHGLPSHAVQEVGCEAVAKMAMHAEKARAVVALHALPTIYAALDRHLRLESVQCVGLKALIRISCVSDDLAALVFVTGGVERLYAAVDGEEGKDTSKQVQVMGLGLMASLARYATGKKCLVATGAITRVDRTLTRYCSAGTELCQLAEGTRKLLAQSGDGHSA